MKSSHSIHLTSLFIISSEDFPKMTSSFQDVNTCEKERERKKKGSRCSVLHPSAFLFVPYIYIRYIQTNNTSLNTHTSCLLSPVKTTNINGSRSHQLSLINVIPGSTSTADGQIKASFISHQ